MSGFRCGGTRWIPAPEEGKVRSCPGCPDCRRCHGTKRIYRYEPIMVGPNTQACMSGGPSFTQYIEPCPGCIDCQPRTLPMRYEAMLPDEFKMLREMAGEVLEPRPTTGEVEAHLHSEISARWALRLLRTLDVIERLTDERDRQTEKLITLVRKAEPPSLPDLDNMSPFDRWKELFVRLARMEQKIDGGK